MRRIDVAGLPLARLESFQHSAFVLSLVLLDEFLAGGHPTARDTSGY